MENMSDSQTCLESEAVFEYRSIEPKTSLERMQIRDQLSEDISKLLLLRNNKLLPAYVNN